MGINTWFSQIPSISQSYPLLIEILMVGSRSTRGKNTNFDRRSTIQDKKDNLNRIL